jgi:hypothetical protein
MDYKLLTGACGGSINPESLTAFKGRLERAEFEDDPDCDEIIRQYREFMYDAGKMFAPKGWSREAQLDHLVRYIGDKVSDMGGATDEAAEDAIRNDILARIGELGL